jgi:hypothetical protein
MSGSMTQLRKRWQLRPTNSSSGRWPGIRLCNAFDPDLGFLEVAHSGIDQEFAVADTLDPCFEHASSSFRNNTSQESSNKERIDFSHCRVWLG